MDVKLSTVGRATLVGREGNKLVAYRDSVGVWTIASGVTTASGLITVTPGLTLTAAAADALNAKAFAKYAAEVASVVKVPLAEHQADALISLCYNIGPGAFERSTVLKRLNAGDYAGAAEAILMWNRPAALIPRRQAERDQFLTPYATALPRARRNDAKPVAAAGGASASPAAPISVAPKVPSVASKPPVVAPPAGAGGLIGRTLARLRAGFPTPAKG